MFVPNLYIKTAGGKWLNEELVSRRRGAKCRDRTVKDMYQKNVRKGGKEYLQRPKARKRRRGKVARTDFNVGVKVCPDWKARCCVTD